MTVNVPYFPEAGIVAKEGEKIVVKIPEGSTVYIAIKGAKGSSGLVPVPLPQQAQPAAQSPVTQHHNAGQKVATYKPKVNQPNAGKNAPAATTNTASAANGAANGDSQQRKNNNNRNGQKNRNRNNHGSPATVPAEKVITVEDLKRQRQEQAKHEAWLAQRKEFERKEREEQDRRYKERVERQKKLKEEAEARRKKEKEEKGEKDEEEQSAEGGEKGEKEKKSCWVCGSEKHISRKCSARCKRSACNEQFGHHSIEKCKEVCLLCEQKGHDEWYCVKRCPMCKRGVGEPHLLEDCPVECRLCGAKGHRDRDCEYSYGNRH